MKSAVNTQALNSAAKVLANQARALSEQGYEEMYFSAQFWSGGRKQNGILRGDVTKISKQVRDYIRSEEADTMSVEIFEEGTDKSVYRRKFSDLYDKGQQSSGVYEQKGLGAAEVNELVARGISESRREDEFNRLNTEVEELRAKNASLTNEKVELETTLKAKKDTEYYMGIIGAAFPGLAPLFQGTPLAQAASFLAGTSDFNGQALPQAQEASDDTKSISAMVGEFCGSLSSQEANAIHLLFMAFESDRSKIQSALHHITAGNLSTAKPLTQ